MSFNPVQFMADALDAAEESLQVQTERPESVIRRLFRYIFVHERILSPCANRVLGLKNIPERIRFFLPSTTFGYISHFNLAVHCSDRYCFICQGKME